MYSYVHSEAVSPPTRVEYPRSCSSSAATPRGYHSTTPPGYHPSTSPAPWGASVVEEDPRAQRRRYVASQTRRMREATVAVVARLREDIMSSPPGDIGAVEHRERAAELLMAAEMRVKEAEGAAGAQQALNVQLAAEVESLREKCEEAQEEVKAAQRECELATRDADEVRDERDALAVKLYAVSEVDEDASTLPGVQNSPRARDPSKETELAREVDRLWVMLFDACVSTEGMQRGSLAELEACERRAMQARVRAVDVEQKACHWIRRATSRISVLEDRVKAAEASSSSGSVDVVVSDLEGPALTPVLGGGSNSNEDAPRTPLSNPPSRRPSRRSSGVSSSWMRSLSPEAAAALPPPPTALPGSLCFTLESVGSSPPIIAQAWGTAKKAGLMPGDLILRAEGPSGDVQLVTGESVAGMAAELAVKDNIVLWVERDQEKVSTLRRKGSLRRGSEDRGEAERLSSQGRRVAYRVEGLDVQQKRQWVKRLHACGTAAHGPQFSAESVWEVLEGVEAWRRGAKALISKRGSLEALREVCKPVAPEVEEGAEDGDQCSVEGLRIAALQEIFTTPMRRRWVRAHAQALGPLGASKALRQGLVKAPPSI
eukprot:Hpha_TRINITY_DN15867_c0_g3::TRINITY_DN15867_c0_g3_i3::g.188831::m.188831